MGFLGRIGNVKMYTYDYIPLGAVFDAIFMRWGLSHVILYWDTISRNDAIFVGWNMQKEIIVPSHDTFIACKFTHDDL